MNVHSVDCRERERKVCMCVIIWCIDVCTPSLSLICNIQWILFTSLLKIHYLLNFHTFFRQCCTRSLNVLSNPVWPYHTILIVGFWFSIVCCLYFFCNWTQVLNQSFRISLFSYKIYIAVSSFVLGFGFDCQIERRERSRLMVEFLMINLTSRYYGKRSKKERERERKRLRGNTQKTMNGCVLIDLHSESYIKYWATISFAENFQIQTEKMAFFCLLKD